VRKHGVCMFVFFKVLLSRSEAGMLIVRGVHSSNKHCLAVYRPISMWFSDFFQKGLLFQVHYIVLIYKPIVRNGLGHGY